VKYVIPLRDGKIAQPEEGELHQRFKNKRKLKNTLVWSVDIDTKDKTKSFYAGLQMLWDA
jgi:hypothetical protein